MIEITDQQIQEAYAQAPAKIIDIATAERTALFIDELTDAYHIQKELKSVVAEEILFLLLKLVGEPEVPERLSIRIGIGLADAQSLINQFTTWLEGRPLLAPDTTTVATEPRPLTREELMQKLSPRRTMVQDVASVQHPTASQPTSAPAQGYEAYQNKNV